MEMVGEFIREGAQEKPEKHKIQTSEAEGQQVSYYLVTSMKYRSFIKEKKR